MENSLEKRFESYINGVLNGSEIAGKLVQMAVKRHLNDLKRKDVSFDWKKAERACQFFETYLKHFKGTEFAGQKFVLAPFQVFILANIFGWQKDGLRKYRTAYIQLARKAGKSMLSAGTGLYMLVGDQEPGAECYSVATKLQQARIIFDAAKTFVEQSPKLKKFIQIRENNLSVKRTASKFMPLGADYNTLDGLDSHYIGFDEMHAHKTADVFDVMVTSMGARTQPLMLITTTAGVYRPGSVCLDQYNFGVKILNGDIENDSFFAFIAQLDEGDHWLDEKVWKKANPNLGVNPKIENLREHAEKAKVVPAAETSFKMKLLNEWVESEISWLKMDHWDNCKSVIDWEKFKGRKCYGGLDLSTTEDLTAFVLLFPPEAEGEPFAVKPYLFIPEDKVIEKSKTDRVPYRRWVKDGHVIATEGNQVDYGVIKRTIEKAAMKFNIIDVAYDRFNSAHLVQELIDEGLTMTPVSQGIGAISGPSKELQRMIMAGEVIHDGNPCLRWNLANVVIKVDDNENIKPSKKKSADRIDGTYAFIMAIAAMQNYEEEPVKTSVYDKRSNTISALEEELQEIKARSQQPGRMLTDEEFHRIDEITLELEKLNKDFLTSLNW